MIYILEIYIFILFMCKINILIEEIEKIKNKRILTKLLLPEPL